MQGVYQLMMLVREGIRITYQDISFTTGTQKADMRVYSPFEENEFHLVPFNEMKEFIASDAIIQSGNFDLSVVYSSAPVERSEEFQTNATFSKTTLDGQTIALEPDRWRFNQSKYITLITLIFMVRDDIMMEDDELLAT